MPTLYLKPKHYENLQRYLVACHNLNRLLETVFDSDRELDEMEEYEHKYKKRLMHASLPQGWVPAFDDSTDEGEVEMIDASFELTAANRIRFITEWQTGIPAKFFDVEPMPCGWYDPSLAP